MWKLEIGPTEALVLQARSPAGGALLVAGAFLAVLFTMLVYLVQRSGTRPAFDQRDGRQHRAHRSFGGRRPPPGDFLRPGRHCAGVE